MAAVQDCAVKKILLCRDEPKCFDLIQENPGSLNTVADRVVHGRADNFIVFDQMMIGVFGKSQRGKHERVEGGQAQKAGVRVVLAKPWQIVADDIVSKQERGIAKGFVQFGQCLFWLKPALEDSAGASGQMHGPDFQQKIVLRVGFQIKGHALLDIAGKFEGIVHVPCPEKEKICLSLREVEGKRNARARSEGRFCLYNRSRALKYS